MRILVMFVYKHSYSDALRYIYRLQYSLLHVYIVVCAIYL